LILFHTIPSFHSLKASRFNVINPIIPEMREDANVCFFEIFNPCELLPSRRSACTFDGFSDGAAKAKSTGPFPAAEKNRCGES
jgi:hypothetical protein